MAEIVPDWKLGKDGIQNFQKFFTGYDWDTTEKRTKVSLTHDTEVTYISKVS